MLLTQHEVHGGPNLLMAFSILTFNQNWTRTQNVCYILSSHYRVYIAEYCFSDKLSFDGINSQSLFLRWHKGLSVSRLSFPCFSHCHLFPSSVVPLSLKNWPWRAFSFHLIRRCFFFSLAYFITFLSVSSAATAIIPSLLLRAYSAKFCLPSLTQSSILTTPAPPSLLGAITQRLISDAAHHTWC